MADPTVDSIATWLRSQYNTGAGGSGSWDDAGYDRAYELAQLLVKAGVTSPGDLLVRDYTYQTQGNRLLNPDEYEVRNENLGGGDSEQWQQSLYGKDGNRINAFAGDDGQWYTYGDIDASGQQLYIGDTGVGYLGDYNNDGTYGNKSSPILSGRDGEQLLAWSARGDGNTSYRIIKDPNTGQLYIAPGWNSSSDAGDFRTAATFLGGAALGGLGATGALAGAAGLGGTAAGSALTGAAVGAGSNMVMTQDINQDTLNAALLGGLGGVAGHYIDGLMPQTNTSGMDLWADPNYVYRPTGLDLTGADAWDDVMNAGIDPEWYITQGGSAGVPAGTSGINPGDVLVEGTRIPTVGPSVGTGIGSLAGNVDVFTGPGEQVVEVEGKRIPQEDPDGYYYPGDPYFDTPDSNPTTPDNNQTTPDNNPDYGNEPVEPRPTPPTSESNPFLDWIKANPKLAISLLGPILGEIVGDGNPTAPPGAGGPGTGPQAGMTATPAASLGRQYIPPPPGYRPGFDPEHRYFTGIGAVGTTPTQPTPGGTQQTPQQPAGMTTQSVRQPTQASSPLLANIKQGAAARQNALLTAPPDSSGPEWYTTQSSPSSGTGIRQPTAAQQQMAPLVQQQYEQADQGFSGPGAVGVGGTPIASNYTWGGDPSARILVDTTTQGTAQQAQYNNDPNYWMARDDATGDWLWVQAGQMTPYNTNGQQMVDASGYGQMIPKATANFGG